MNKQIKQLTLIFILALSVMACGLTDLVNQAQEAIGSADELQATAEALATEVAAGVEAAQQAVEEEGAAEGGVEGEVSAPAEASEETVQQDSEAVAPAEESAQADDSAEESMQADVPGAEAMPLPVDSIQNSLENIDSYQAEYIIEVVSAGETGTLAMLIEQTKNPRAMHVIMQGEGDAAGQAGLEQMELYVITQDGSTTMYIQNPEDQSWFAMTGNDMDDAFGMMPISLEALDTLPQQSRFVGEETINGVLTQHYSYNQEDFVDAVPGVQEAQGDVWIAEDKGIVMKIVQQYKSTEALFGTGQPGELSTYTMNFEVKKLDDSSIVIEPPPEALTGESIALPGTSTDPDQIELPMVDDANVELSMTGMINYTTAKSVQEVWAFYQAELGGVENWEVALDSPDNVMADLQNGTQPLQLLITDEDGTTRVILISQ
jgi:hypothetical protein